MKREQSPLDRLAGRRNPVVLDTERKFLFAPNDKVCQQSVVRDVLSTRSIVRKDSEIRWRLAYSRMRRQNFGELFSFTIVRDPFDRAVSAFYYLRRIGEIPREYDFDRFCREVLSTVGLSFNNHFHLQSDSIFVGTRCALTFIGRFERLEEDWPVIADQLDLAPDLPKKNRSARDAGSLRDEYSTSSRDVIAKLYAPDFALLDYSTELRTAL